VIAEPSKPLPTVEKAPSSAASDFKPLLRLTKTDKKNSNGLIELVLSLVKGGTVVDGLTAISGQSWAKNFRTASVSRFGSMEPLPEGYWTVGVLEFVSGTLGNFSGSWGDGLGPLYIELNWGKRGIRKKSDAKPETISQRHFYAVRITTSIYKSLALVADSDFLMQECRKYTFCTG
jgi:hypothetical protein